MPWSLSNGVQIVAVIFDLKPNDQNVMHLQFSVGYVHYFVEAIS